MAKGFWFFDDVNLFEVMCPHKIKVFREEGHFKEYKKGEVIYFSEDPANTLYLIANGKVKLLSYTESGEEAVRHILGRGELFGERALLGESTRDEIAESMVEGTVICPVRIDEVHELMKDNAEFSFKVFRFIGLKLSKLERRVEALVFKDVRQRLVEFIGELAEERGEQQAGDLVVDLNLTHKDIASLIGTSRQTVTSMLNELRKEGLLDFDRKRIRIPDLKALHQSALAY
ncbi:helix-turn-helix domain-containing protein [bacterium]|nr:helix-turn-helix domain-containing protein [bacterium]